MRTTTWIAALPLWITSCCIPLPLGGDDSEPAQPPPTDDPAAVLSPLPSHDATPLDTAPVGPAPVGAMHGLERASLRALADGEVPQVPNRFELFHDAPRLEEADVVEDGLLLCDLRVSTDSDADTFKGPDTSLNVRLGQARPRTARGPEDSWGAVLSMPIARLESGDSVWLRVVDRDVWHDEYIGSDTVVFRGRFPLRFRSDHTRVECRALGTVQVEARVGRPLSQAGTSVDGLERALVPDARLAGFGYPTLERMRVAADLSRAAAWVDWDDPRVGALLDRMDRADALWQQRARGAVEAAAADLPAPGADVPLGPGYEGHVGEVLCGTDANRIVSRYPQLAARVQGAPCLARVAVRRVDGSAQSFGPSQPTPMEVRVLTDDGRSVHAVWVARETDAGPVGLTHPGTVAAGDAAVLLLALPHAPEARRGPRARLLWVRPQAAPPGQGWLARLR